MFRKLFSVVLILSSTAAVAVAQGAYSQGRYAMGWLRSPQVKKELEIADYQVEQIDQLQAKLQADVQEVYADIRKLPREEQAEQYRLAQEKVKKIYADGEAKLKEILLPAQIRRLEQVSAQMRLRGSVAYGLRGELAEKLGLSDQQQKLLQEKAAEKNRELYKKYAELRAQMQQELLEEVLTDKQQKQLDEMIGEPFEFNAGQPLGGMAAAP